MADSVPKSSLGLVCDTSVLLYLGRIAQANLLPALFAAIYVPEEVALELDMGRLLRSDTLDVRVLPWVRVITIPVEVIEALPPSRLGNGERAVIAFARMQPATLAGLDDRQARELAESLGLRVMGTLGILLRAYRAGLIAEVRPHLDALVDQGFRLSASLYDSVLTLAGEMP